MKEHMKSCKGITLIALVITIIVLLILAGVSISIIIGDNGVIGNAQNASVKHTIAQENERIQIAITSARMDSKKGYVKLTFSKLKTAIDKEFGNGKIQVTDNSNGMFTLYSNDSKKTYIITNGEKVVDENDLCKISTEAELASFRDDVNNGNTYEGKYIILMNNITLTNAWIPIGTDTKPFKGNFMGNGCAVSNVNVNVDNYAGFFGYAINASINGLTVNGTIQSNLVDNEKRSGGIVAQTSSVNISNCTNNAIVKGYSYTGGIVGCYGGSGKINNCVNNGAITGKTFSVSGIVGSIVGNNCFILNCGNIGVIVGEESNSCGGGIVGCVFDGKSGTKIYNSYNIANISTQTYAGGLVGLNNIRPSTTDSIEIANCYSIGNVSANSCGGLMHSTHDYANIGRRNLSWSSNVTNAYSTVVGGTPPTLAQTPEATIKSAAFVTTLNNNREDDSWMEWELNSDNFPVIKR